MAVIPSVVVNNGSVEIGSESFTPEEIFNYVDDLLAAANEAERQKEYVATPGTVYFSQDDSGAVYVVSDVSDSLWKLYTDGDGTANLVTKADLDSRGIRLSRFKSDDGSVIGSDGRKTTV